MRKYPYLFNSYYNAVGERIARDRRGLLSRPTVAEVLGYRAQVDQRVQAFLDSARETTLSRVRGTLILGLHHEQQHQELILTDLKHALGCNPLASGLSARRMPRTEALPRFRPSGWMEFPGACDGSVTGGNASPSTTNRLAISSTSLRSPLRTGW